MSLGIWQIMIIAVLVVLLFGRGKISDLMGDVAKGIKSFKKGMSDEEDVASDTMKSIDHKEQENVAAKKPAKRKAAKS